MRKTFWIKQNGEIVELKNFDENFNEYWESGKLIVCIDENNFWLWKFWHRDTEFRIEPQCRYFVHLDGKQLKALKKLLRRIE